MVRIGSNHRNLTVGVTVFLSATIVVRASKNSLGEKKVTKMCIFFIKLLSEGQGPAPAPLQLLAKVVLDGKLQALAREYPLVSTGSTKPPNK